jgi:hypothetical protein
MGRYITGHPLADCLYRVVSAKLILLKPDKMRFLLVALTAALSSVATASLQVVPGGTWTTVSFPETRIKLDGRDRPI